MPSDELTELIRSQQGLVSLAQVRGFGLSRQWVRRREAREWRFVLPGVLTTSPAELLPGQRLVAALLYAGPGALLSSTTAAAWHGVLSAHADRAVRVQVPAARRPPGAGFVVVRRTTRPDDRPWTRGPP
jgi:hypothetical protein